VPLKRVVAVEREALPPGVLGAGRRRSDRCTVRFLVSGGHQST
jgi:hypothetical protein